MPPHNPVRLRGLAPAPTGVATGGQTMQDQDSETSGWIEVPDEDMYETEASGLDDVNENQPPQGWAEEDTPEVVKPMHAAREGMPEEIKLDPAAEGIMEATGASEVMKPAHAARETVPKDVKLTSAAADGIMQPAGSSEVVKPIIMSPGNPVHL